MENKRNWKVAVIKGDGVGPDVVNAALLVLNKVMQKFNLNIEYVPAEAGLNCVEKYGTNLPKETLEILKTTDCVLKGPTTTPEGANSLPSANVGIRKYFDLYADVRPNKTLPKVPSLKPNVDMVIVRENTEGMYSGLDFRVNSETTVGLRIITRKACERIVKYAFELAEKRKKHVTLVHKGNVLKVSDGMFKDIFYETAKNYPDITADDAHVDAITQWFIKQPEFYDVLVTENLFGDIISDEAAMIVGGIGTGASANIGERYAMFEPIHGSVPKYTGMDKVNPIGTVMSVKMMMDWMGYEAAGKAIEDAVHKVLEEGRVLTYDLGGTAKCSEVGKEIAKKISL
ncbi:MAG: isocitrate/isopropylmalate dehydrogenase family protein [Candidatus Parvarchaeota archaeon]|jgi:isopropylmalate/isohomocitrate dehydrogenase-like protein|nr:isocitrate/isopropylmalate dehydrogenase family protein [Candidatus Parvarchaeota archaeon]MCL5420398.1 isocitrate/isopropylmalate dehydrogenase family protein [Candidatus Parvarchaeota archaeon]